MRRVWIFGGLLMAASPAFGQSEQVLREAFEGRTVKVKIDMPATSTGIDVRPGEKPPVDFARLGELMKRQGTSLHTGESVIVTRVKATKNVIEFQLGGGGYGTFGDMLNSSSESDAPSRDKTGHEKQLEDRIRAEADRAKKKALERELRDERSEREHDNARARAEANQANELREANIRTQKLHGGSRFTLRFKNGVPSEYVTPEGLRHALATWVDFGDDDDAPRAASEGGTSKGGAHSLRKGLTLTEVEHLLGPATSATEKREGSMVVLERTYHRRDETIVARYVDDVLVKYSITSE